MAKTNTNNGDSSVGISTEVHLVLQGKGGVGKTCVANILAQYLKSKGHPVKCFDTDPVNASLCRFSGLDTERIPVMEGGQVQDFVFDAMFETMCSEQGPFVVDTGATTFAPLWNYLTSNSVVSVLKQHGRRVLIHIPITGGQSQLDTLQGLEDIARLTPEKILVVWLNEFFGKIETPDRKPFEEMRVFLEYAQKIHGVMIIPARAPATFGADMRNMLLQALTFQEAIDSAKFGIFSKNRLQLIRQDLFTRLESVA